MADRYEPYVTLPDEIRGDVAKAAASEGYPTTNAYLSARIVEAVADDLNAEPAELTGGNYER
jgi:hypothetical protein